MFFFIKFLGENLMNVILFTALFCGIIILTSDKYTFTAFYFIL